MKKILCILLALLTLFSAGCGIISDEEVMDIAADIATDIIEDAFTETEEYPTQQHPDNTVNTIEIDEDGYYYDVENVVLYLYTYGKLPKNYVTKEEARSLGWEGGSVEDYIDGAAIGGDSFGNREELLPEGNYTECDIDTNGQSSRGAKRLVFSDDGRYYYTTDHYESFVEIFVENGGIVYR